MIHFGITSGGCKNYTMSPYPYSSIRNSLLSCFVPTYIDSKGDRACMCVRTPHSHLLVTPRPYSLERGSRVSVEFNVACSIHCSQTWEEPQLISPLNQPDMGSFLMRAVIMLRPSTWKGQYWPLNVSHLLFLFIQLYITWQSAAVMHIIGAVGC